MQWADLLITLSQKTSGLLYTLIRLSQVLLCTLAILSENISETYLQNARFYARLGKQLFVSLVVEMMYSRIISLFSSLLVCVINLRICRIWFIQRFDMTFSWDGTD